MLSFVNIGFDIVVFSLPETDSILSAILLDLLLVINVIFLIFPLLINFYKKASGETLLTSIVILTLEKNLFKTSHVITLTP